MITLHKVDFPTKAHQLYLFKGKYIRADIEEEGVISVTPFKINKERNYMSFTTSNAGGGFLYHTDSYKDKLIKPYFLEGEWYEVE
jgi:hypothetical protein